MKSLALIAICKNEEKHIERWLNTFLPVVDHVYLTDTGSTDQTVAIARVVGKNKITIKHFKWIEDFAAARNFSQEGVKEDFILWADLDDSLKNPEAFLEWRKNIHLVDMWLANYNYALLPDGKSACTFVRERVYRNDPKFSWRGFVHEGLDSAVMPITTQFAHGWAIDHLRTPEDLAADKGRNVGIFDRKKAAGVEFDSRMLYYYGKELFEANRPDEGLKQLLAANSKTDLQPHDRTLCIQYATYILLQKGEYIQAANLALSGVLLQPQRAEFYVLIGDCYIKLNRLKDALPFYEAAKACEALPEQGFGGFIFQNRTAYTDYPRNQIARIYAQLGMFERGAKEAKEAYELFKNPESEAVFKACEEAANNAIKYKKARPCDDIVFTCPGGLYEWDSKVYKERGIGGSETACVEMATWLKKLTKRQVLVFNERKEVFEDENGVIYTPLEQMHSYFSAKKPALHVAWRHNFKMTDAKTIVWSHDLLVPGGEKSQDFDKYLALSKFHAGFVKAMINVPDEKLCVTRNGIDPLKFKWENPTKNPNKVIYVSSPDRGLDRAIEVCEIARASLPDLELHVFYGLDNLVKMGKAAEVEHFKQLMDKPWIHAHGNLPQAELMKHYQDAAIWLYPANFLETFCISALETVLCGVYPIVRNYGALPNTLEGIPSTIVDRDCVTFEDKIYWAKILTHSIEQKLWQNIDKQTHSKILGLNGWEQVSREWIGEFLDDDCIRCND